MTIQILLLLAGLALVVLGADWLVDGASSIARKTGLSEFVIGLTIVGFGTSCPELVVSLTGAFEGNAEVAIGNVVGSNIFNILLILGITAVLVPVTITKENKTTDIPIMVGVTLLLILCGMSHTLLGLGKADMLTRIEGVVFLIVFALYLWHCFRSNTGVVEGEEGKRRSVPVSIVLVLAGLAGLIFGGKLFVNSATGIAQMLGVSDKFIAITILAGGTSLPELATSVVAALKGKGQLALGNILGSNVFNILLILGLSSIVCPLSFASMNLVDMGILLLSAVLVLLSAFSFRKNSMDRTDGAILLLCYAGYLFWLFKNM